MTEAAIQARASAGGGSGGGSDIDKGYEPARVEAHWAKWWEEKGFFRSQDTSEKPPFSMVLPPPNVTGSLHIGHALTATIGDALVRYKRMSGYNTSWLPGIDHAGIATQMVVEREIKKKEGKSRQDLGREEFLKRVWAWKEQSGGRIAVQHRALGASLDWDRERFTMDEQSSRAVREAFVKLYEDGLLYRAERLINWCVSCRTALSDLEVDHEENVKSELYKFAYPLADARGGAGFAGVASREATEGGALEEIVVATTRPETMLGDTAVAVHPDDPRYQSMIGKSVRHPITGREFPIIADAELVDPKFGTGAVKVTPGHSFEDFEAGKRHSLKLINILNLDGTLNENAGLFQGQDRIKVRPALKERLKELGLDRGTEPHTIALGRCQRCANIVEPLLSKQWFVKTGPLAEKVISDVNEIRFVPTSWRAEFLRWLHHIHDWCVSRQLWWGHQIPAWYCEYEHVTVSRETPRECAECHSGRLKQDQDVLDTWFSSGLWPFSTFGWPEQTPALKTFYPNSVMETGFDILFFWVARMAMLGMHFMGELPFKVVFLHAMVRDEKGEKMSKTRGNVIDPLDVTAKYGADALRFTLASMSGQGRDIKLATDRIAGYRAFANKIWNAARFVLMNAEGYDPRAQPASVYDRWILSRFQRCADETRAAMDEFRLGDAANGIYRFIWNELCDWAIELEKPALYGEKSPRERAGAQASLLKALEGALRLLHPFMPFVTEEVWQRLPNKSGETIMLAPFPGPGPVDEEAEGEMAVIARAIEGARSLRSEVGRPTNERGPIIFVPVNKMIGDLFQTHGAAFEKLANASLTILDVGTAVFKSAVFVYRAGEVHLPLIGLFDPTRAKKEIAAADAELEKIRARLENPGFVDRAPREVVEKDRARAEELVGKRDKLARHLARISSLEAGMDEKNPQQGQRGMDQMGTHGGPAKPTQSAGQAVEEKAKEMVEAAKVAMTPMVERMAQQVSQAAASAGEAMRETAAAVADAVVAKTDQARSAVAKRLAPKKAVKKQAKRKAAAKKAPKKKAAAKKAARKAKPAKKKGKKGKK